jgi:hypothetical protein
MKSVCMCITYDQNKYDSRQLLPAKRMLMKSPQWLQYWLVGWLSGTNTRALDV